MKTRKILTWNMYVNWGLMALMCSLLAVGYLLDGLPFPKVAVLITLIGLCWAVTGIGYCMVALYFAWRQHILTLWGSSFAMSFMALFSFMKLASTY